MSIDNRTELNDCDTVTGWTGDGASPAVITDTGQFYEGTGGIESQHSNTDEHMSTTQESVGATTFSLDLTDSTCYLLLKDNLVQSLANGGVQYVIGDGTDKVGYDVGGSDSSGLPLVPFYNCYKLDVSNRPAAFNAYTGTEATLTVTAITEFGVGTLHNAKAVGNVANITIDYISYIANGSPALTINGGTVGTPETMVDVQGDDVTNGWGLVSNPFGSQFLFMAPTEWGDGTTLDSYFTVADEQWFWIGGVAGIGNFDFGLTANATGTNSFVVQNTVIVGLDVRSALNLAPANHDIMKLDSVTFTDIGAITFPTIDATNKWANNCIFNNCDQLIPSTITMDSPSFNGTTDANGAIILTSTTDNLDNASFTSDGTGHAIYITATGTYNFDTYTYSGYGATTTSDAVIYNNSGGAVTINVLGGDVPTYRNGTSATTSIVQSYTLTLTNIPTGVTVTIVNSSTRTELQYTADTSDLDVTYVHSGGETVDILLNSLAYDPNLSDIYDLTLDSADQAIKFQMLDDNNYSNP